MQIQDITNQVLDAVEKGRAKSTADLYADNFTFTGPMPMELNKNQYLDIMSKVTAGAPDWKFNRHDLRVEGQTVVVPVQITGTQTKTLPALMPDMRDLPPTNRSFRIPPEVSGPREFHPRALSEPDMNLSAHPAPIIQP